MVTRWKSLGSRNRRCEIALYEYACPECGHKFERILPMSEAGKPARCPNCKKKALPVVSVPAKFQWRGGKPHWST